MYYDLRYAFRTLSRAPVFTAVAVLSLALGIGANTAIFSLLDQVLLRLLPVRDPEQVVVLHEAGVKQGSFSSDNSETVLSYPVYRDLRDRSQVFAGVIARAQASVTLIANDQAEQARAETVSGNFFDVLGVRPVIGRLLSASDDMMPGGHPVVVLSYGYWTRRFGTSTAILNQTVRVNGLPMTVVGVAQRSFHGLISGQTPDIYLTLSMKAQASPGWNGFNDYSMHWINLFARLKPGMHIRQAEAAIAPLYHALLEEENARMSGRPPRFRTQFLQNRLQLRPASQGINQLSRQWEKPLLVVMVMVGLVLLIACANVANLLVARAAGRRKEIAIRLALGASRWSLVRQLLVESLTLSLAGGLLGLVFSYWMTKGLIGFVNSLGGWLQAHVDIRLLAFTFALAMITGVLFGLAPAISATRADVTPVLKDHGSSASKGQARFRRALVSAQVALSLVLLIGAGLFVRSLINLLHHDLGFRAEHLLLFSINPALGGYKNPDALALLDRIQDRLRALPGVVSVAASQGMPLSHSNSTGNVTVEGYNAAEDENTDCDHNLLSPGYFRTLGVPLVAGREFTAADTAAAPKVVIVNETFARHFFKGRNPLGHHMTPGAGTVKLDMEIVGVVRDSRYSSIREKTSRFFYNPLAQQRNWQRVSVAVRTAVDVPTLEAQARAIVREIDSNLPVFGARRMQVQVEESIYIERLIASLAAAFGALATLLATVGLYGVIAYMVARRTVEIGIRMALGASRRRILGLVMREVGLLALAGLVVGTPCALAGARYVESQLFGIRAADPWIIIGAVTALGVAAVLAGYLPARRAVTIDPLRALRYE
jgi:predicted permease